MQIVSNKTPGVVGVSGEINLPLETLVISRGSYMFSCPPVSDCVNDAFTIICIRDTSNRRSLYMQPIHMGLIYAVSAFIQGGKNTFYHPQYLINNGAPLDGGMLKNIDFIKDRESGY